MNYKIFQILDNKNDRLFQCLERIGGVKGVSANDYSCIYEGEIRESRASRDSVLESLWRMFNIKHPEDYYGRSLSVSDIVAIDDKAYFCDYFGWVEIPDFIVAYHDASPDLWKCRIQNLASIRSRGIVLELCDEACPAAYTCHKKHDAVFAACGLMGTETTCPLAKYNVPESVERSGYCAMSITLDDLAMMCANCENADINTENGDSFTLSLDRCFDTHCIDCPVQSMRESIQELAAEAAMS